MTDESVDYDEIADAYDERYRANRYDGIERELRAFVGGENHAILEAGCGTGHWLSLLTRDGASVAGIDPSAEMLKRARQRLPAADLAVGRAERLPWKDQSFDRGLCINALHHFDDPNRFIREARRVLREDGGLMIIGIDPHMMRDRWWIYDTFSGALERDQARYPSTRAIRSWMKDAGFSAIRSTVAQHIALELPVSTALQRGHLAKRSTSQLVLLSDQQYEAGIADILEQATPASTLTVDLRLWATEGWIL